MNPKEKHNTSDEIIDFDDEYCENINDQEQQTPETPEKIDNQINQEDQVQGSPDEFDEEKNNQDLDEENIIYDPKVKELNELDINNKQAIIDILMNDDLIIKKEIKGEDIIKEKNKMKFGYVKSAINLQNGGTPDSMEKKSAISKNLYQLESKDGDPEYIKDINVAANLLKEQIVEENEDVAKLLFDDITKTKNSKKMLTGKEISQKIKDNLEKRKKHLEEIEDEMYKKQRDEERFVPKINKRKKDGEKRNLNSFLEAQNKFLKDIENKKQDMLLKTENDMKNMNYGKPKVDKKSEKIVQKFVNTGPAYLRLYNKRNNNEKIKEVEEKLSLQKKEEEKKRLKEENALKKNNPYKHIKSKINIHQSTKNPNTPAQINKNNSPKKMLRGKSAINVMRQNDNSLINNNIKKKFDYKDIQTNKMLYNKFISCFDEILISLGQGEESKNNENNLEELDEYQYCILLYRLGMIAYPPDVKEKDKNEENKEEEKNPQPENNLKLNEKKLINDSFNILKLDGNKVKIIDIKNFLICILDLQNYHLYQLYKSNHEQELKDLFPQDKFKKEDIPDLIITKQNKELLSNIDKTNKLNNKYFSLTTDNKIIFTLDKISNIKKDFNMLSLNYRNQKKKGKDDKVINIIKQQYPFKPEINENSNKIYQKYKDKVFSIQNETVTSNSNSQLKKSNMEYIDRILLLDKKRIAVTQKIKEEMEQKQIKECTFKPRINNYYVNKKSKNLNDKEEKKTPNDISQDNQNNENDKKLIINQNKKNKTKFDELYEVGKTKLKNKSVKSWQDIEYKEQESECTFHPNIKGLNPKKIPKTNFTNDIYNEKEYKILYERLKHGRLERMVKESSNDRYGLNNELKQFVKDNKEYNFIQNQQYFDPDDPFYYNNTELNNMMNSLNNQFEQENIEKSNVIKDNNSSTSNNNNKSKEITKAENVPYENKDNNIKNKEDNNISENAEEENNNLIMEKNNNVNEEVVSENELEKEKNDDIPLLIIDVNIRQGVKKKIYVYEGDTPEALAEKFAEEQNLDVDTKNKLQSLIQTHMQKLLTRIEEENQSNSEKSQNIHGIKNI